MVLGAEQGIFALDLSDMSAGADGDAPLIQVYHFLQSKFIPYKLVKYHL
jgi:hypothetical protein